MEVFPFPQKLLCFLGARKKSNGNYVIITLIINLVISAINTIGILLFIEKHHVPFYLSVYLYGFITEIFSVVFCATSLVIHREKINGLIEEIQNLVKKSETFFITEYYESSN